MVGGEEGELGGGVASQGLQRFRVWMAEAVVLSGGYDGDGRAWYSRTYTYPTRITKSISGDP